MYFSCKKVKIKQDRLSTVLDVINCNCITPNIYWHYVFTYDATNLFKLKGIFSQIVRKLLCFIRFRSYKMFYVLIMYAININIGGLIIFLLVFCNCITLFTLVSYVLKTKWFGLFDILKLFTVSKVAKTLRYIPIYRNLESSVTYSITT